MLERSVFAVGFSVDGCALALASSGEFVFGDFVDDVGNSGRENIINVVLDCNDMWFVFALDVLLGWTEWFIHATPTFSYEKKS